jgi:hypothetical protein
LGTISYDSIRLISTKCIGGTLSSRKPLLRNFVIMIPVVINPEVEYGFNTPPTEPSEKVVSELKGTLSVRDIPF